MRKRAIEIDGVLEFDRDYVRYFAAGSSVGITARSIEDLDASIVRGKRIAIAVSRKMTFVRALPFPDASDADLQMILRGKIGEIFPMPAHELSFGLVKTDKKDVNGRICTVYAIRSDDAKALLQETDSLGIRVEQILPVGSIPIPQISHAGPCVVVEHLPKGFGIDVFQDGVHTQSRSYGESASPQEEVNRLCELGGMSSPVVLSTWDILTTATQIAGPIASLLPKSDISLDLEPEAIRIAKQAKTSKDRHMRAYLAAICSFGIALFVANDWILKSTAVEKKQAKAQVQVNRVKSLQTLLVGKITKLQPEAEQLKRAFQPAQPISDVALVVSSLTPKGLWLTGMNIERGKPVSLRGTAKDASLVATFVKSLGEQSRFRDVKLVFANLGEVESIPVIQFSITAFPVGNLPIIEQGKRR